MEFDPSFRGIFEECPELRQEQKEFFFAVKGNSNMDLMQAVKVDTKARDIQSGFLFEKKTRLKSMLYIQTRNEATTTVIL